MMRKILQLLLICQALLASAQVGVHTDFPDNSSAMDIVASNKGLLIPRVSLTSSLSNPSPVTSPAVGLLVFNSGSNQAIGFYYWNGTSWVLIGSGSSSGNYWSITGNSGTTPGTNFLGTTDNNHFLIYTNNSERMRLESDGQVIIGNTVPQSNSDVLTVFGNTTQNFAIAAYSPTVGFYTLGGRYGAFAQVDTACNPNPGYAMYAKNTDLSGYGIYAVGSGVSSLPLITNHTAAITSYGYDGIHAWGRNATSGHGLCAIGSGLNSSFALTGISAGISTVGNYGIIAKGSAASGRGIVAVGSGQSSPSTTSESEGGAFLGFHGVYGKGIGYQITPVLLAGIGVVGIGYNASTYSTLPNGLGLGGSFSGDYGVYGKGLNITDGVGVLGVGSGGSGYYTLTNGSGGAFTGYHGLLAVGLNATGGIGVFGAGNNGVYTLLPSFGAGGSFTGINIGAAGFGTSSANGIGVIGSGNNQAVWVPSNGCGGSFSGNTGIFCRSSNATGTGIVSSGNNVATPGTFAAGTGGAFTGLPAGVVGWATDGTAGTGVIGSGNAIAIPLTYATGSGGAFTGTNAGLVAYGTTAASGTGIIGAGNAIATPLTYTTGSGGAFTGTNAGLVAYGTTAASGVGVIGLGNNITTAVLPGTSGCGGAFTGATYGVAAFANTAGSTSYGVFGKYNGGGNNDGVGVYGYSAPATSRGYGVSGYGNKYGVLGVQGTAGNNNYGVYATGNLACSGTKSFAIDHPMDPENKFLKHFSVESPEVLNMYRGNVFLDQNGSADISLPDYFIIININFSYALTPVGQPAPNLYIKKEIDNQGTFSIAGGNPGQKISWVIYAERNDPYMQQEGIRAIEIEKDDYEKGKYLMPELYNQPPEKGLFYSESFNQENPAKTGKSNGVAAEQPSNINQITILEVKPLQTITSGKESFKTSQNLDTKTLEVKEDQVIEPKDDPK
jgi:hypothetical protein